MTEENDRIQNSESAKFAHERWDWYTKELAVIQALDKSANIEMAADWAFIGQTQFDKEKYSESSRSFVQATLLLERARKSCRVQNRFWGWFCVLLEIAYLLLLIGAPYLAGLSLTDSEITALCAFQLNEQISCDTSREQENNSQPITDSCNSFWIEVLCQECNLSNDSATIWLRYMAGEILLRNLQVFRIPLIFFAGGFLGGIAWCMHNGISWMGKRLFDFHLVIWYVAHPFVSTILGGIVSFLFLSGLITLVGQETVNYGGIQECNLTLFATIMLFAFGAGFSAKYIWQKLDSLVRKILGIEEASDVFHDKVLQEVAQPPKE